MPFKHRVVVGVLAVMAVALSACGSDDAQPDETTTTSSEQPTQEKPSSDDGSESKDEAGGGLDVTVAGDQGVLALKRSEEHTSELQSRGHLVCRLLLATINSMRAPG